MKGRLLIGIDYEGKLYFDFSVKLLSLLGECQALELLDELSLNKDEAKRSRSENMLNELAFLSQQLEITGIPQEKLTPSFLLNHLSPQDYVIIWKRLDELRKKHINAGESLN